MRLPPPTLGTQRPVLLERRALGDGRTQARAPAADYSINVNPRLRRACAQGRGSEQRPARALADTTHACAAPQLRRGDAQRRRHRPELHQRGARRGARPARALAPPARSGVHARRRTAMLPPPSLPSTHKHPPKASAMEGIGIAYAVQRYADMAGGRLIPYTVRPRAPECSCSLCVCLPRAHVIDAHPTDTHNTQKPTPSGREGNVRLVSAAGQQDGLVRG